MALRLSEEEIQLAELVAEHFSEYAWASRHLAGFRDRRALAAQVLRKKSIKHGVYQRYGKFFIYGLALLLLVLQHEVYTAMKLSPQIIGVGAAVIAHQAFGGPVGQLEKIEPAVGYSVRGRAANGCPNLTIYEMARWKATGLGEFYQLCG